MNLAVQIIQLVLAGAMIDVWWLRYKSPGVFRGGDARTMEEEFRVYGLPDWVRNATRAIKLGCAAGMILGLWWADVALVAAIVLALMMLGAVTMHVKVSDPVYKSAPAALFLILCLVTMAHHWPTDA